MASVHPVTPAVAASSSLPTTRPAVTRTQRLAAICTGYGAVLARYTIAKFVDFDGYRRSASGRRIAAVVALTPLPPLLATLVPIFIPLQDPQRGPTENVGYWLHFLVTVTLIAAGANLLYRGGASIPHDEYKTTQVFVSAVLAAAQALGLAVLLGVYWRFPTPFLPILLLGPSTLFLATANALVLHRRLWASARLRGAIVAFFPAFVGQTSQMAIYPLFSAVFYNTTDWGRVVLTLLFPVLKHFIKRLLRRLARELREESEEVAVAGTEICAAMYQSAIMQSGFSPVATAVIIAIDVLEGLVAVGMFMEKDFDIPQTGLFEQAQARLRAMTTPLTDADLETFGSKKELGKSFRRVLRRVSEVTPLSPIATEDEPSRGPTIQAIPPLLLQSSSLASPPRATSSDVKPTPLPQASQLTTRDKHLVTCALESMLAAETILLVEYIEVIVPLTNAGFLLAATHVDSVRFNVKLGPFYHDEARLRGALGSLLLYTGLQGLSLVAMSLVMWYRFRLSAMAHLAFVLERHWWSILGKLLLWFATFFHFYIVHYGNDFTFRFDFAVPVTDDAQGST